MARVSRSFFFVLGVGLLLSCLIAGQFYQNRQELNAQLFERVSSRQFLFISQSLNWHIGTLHRVGGYFLASSSVTPEEFALYTRSLINGDASYDAIGWIDVAGRDDWDRHRQSWAEDGIPLPPDIHAGAFPRYVLTRVATRDAHAGILGLNLGADPEFRQLLEEVVQNKGMAFLAGDVGSVLGHDGEDNGHLLTAYPVYYADDSARMMGIAFSKLEMRPIMSAANDADYKPYTHLVMSVEEGDGEVRELYHSMDTTGVSGTPYSFTRDLVLGNVTIRMAFTPTQLFLQHYRNTQSIIIFVMMALMSLAAAVYIQQMRDNMLVLEDANRRAAESSRIKNEFMATMSHEIRSPMTGVLGMAELLLEGDLGEEQRNYARTIVNSAESLLTIINDILDFSRIEANKLELEPAPVNLLEIVDDLCGLHSIRAREKALELAVRYVPGTEQFVWADPTRIRQILGNLISNAIKFTEKGSVVVTVREDRSLPCPDGQVRIVFSVEDTGIGIPGEALERIFDKFFQLDGSYRRDAGGMGLGLAISKRLVEAMGGEIGVQSIAARGSVFTFSVVVRRNSDESYAPLKPMLLRDVKILVVDDLPIVRTVVAEQLNLSGMRCASAASGEDALDMMTRASALGDPYKIVLIDYLMPDMDGEALARAISDSPQLADACLVMLTGAGLPVVAEAFVRKGFSAHIAKPLRDRFLTEALAVIWRRYQEGDTRTLIRVDAQYMRRPNHGVSTTIEGAHILVAEDSRINQAFVEDTLAHMGCRVTIAPNGQEAVRAAQAGRFDLILMDCQMPVMDGFEATRQICALKESGAVPKNLCIVALTANSMKGDREKCFAAGMDDYLSKPVRSRELKDKVQFWVTRSRESVVAPVAHTAEAPAVEAVTAPMPAPVSGGDGVIDFAATAEAKRILKARYHSILSAYVEDMEGYMAEIDAALAQNDLEAGIRPAHTIKSSSRHMGAVTMAGQAEAFEKALRHIVETSGDVKLDVLRQRLSDMRVMFGRTRDVLMQNAG